MGANGALRVQVDAIGTDRADDQVAQIEAQRQPRRRKRPCRWRQVCPQRERARANASLDVETIQVCLQRQRGTVQSSAQFTFGIQGTLRAREFSHARQGRQRRHRRRTQPETQAVGGHTERALGVEAGVARRQRNDHVTHTRASHPRLQAAADRLACEATPCKGQRDRDRWVVGTEAQRSVELPGAVE